MFKLIVVCAFIIAVNAAPEYHDGGYGVYTGYGGYGSGLYGGYSGVYGGYGHGYGVPVATSYSSRVDYPTKHYPVVSSYVAPLPVITKAVVAAPVAAYAAPVLSSYGTGHGLYGSGLHHNYDGLGYGGYGSYGGYGYGSGYGSYLGSGYGYDGHLGSVYKR